MSIDLHQSRDDAYHAARGDAGDDPRSLLEPAPSSESRLPRRAPIFPAPARFGAAGLSADRGRAIKRSLPHRLNHRKVEAIADGLGWFSIALGITELLCARGLGRSLGMEDRAGLIRLFGLREVATGIGILSQPHPRDKATWVRARIAGDALDLAALAPGLSPDNPRQGAVAGAVALIAAAAVLDLACAAMLGRIDR